MMKLTTGVAFVALVFAAAPARAQQAEVPEPPLKGAPRVIVTDRAGQETIGRLISWTGSSIVIRTNGADRTYAPGEAVRLDLRGDSLKNGAMIGAAFGALGGLIADCPDRSCGGARVALTVSSIGIWAAVGAGIDALIPGRSPLWSSGSSQTSAPGLTFGLSPRDGRASIGWRFLIPNP